MSKEANFHLTLSVADGDFTWFYEQVLDLTRPRNTSDNDWPDDFQFPSARCVDAMWSFFNCLSEAVSYVHSRALKHLDIKPGNILVRRDPSCSESYTVYLADFGISRCFPSLDHSKTDTAVPRTPKYCAPEFWNQGTHGRAADIFSLGCVFTEMLTVLCGRDLEEYAEFRLQRAAGTTSYHENLDRVALWLQAVRPSISARRFDMIMSGTRRVYWDTTFNFIVAISSKIAEDPKQRAPFIMTLVYPNGMLQVEHCSRCDSTVETYRAEEENLEDK